MTKLEIDIQNGYKICNHCNETKSLNKFSLRRKEGYYSAKCYSCQREIHIARKQANFPRKKSVYEIDIEMGWKKCRKCHNQLTLDNFFFNTHKESFETRCKTCVSKQARDSQSRREWRIKNKERLKIYNAERYARPDVKSHNQKKAKEYYKNNKQRIGERNKQYRQRKEIKLLNNKRERERIKNDIHFKIKKLLNNNIYQAVIVQKVRKQDKMLNLIGLTVNELKKYLESKFQPGMTWDTYGEWEIDHVVPCALFDLSQETHQRACFNYSNLQPLWHYDNMLKMDYLENGKKARELNSEEKKIELIRLGFAYLFK